jgi:hypothetical protein
MRDPPKLIPDLTMHAITANEDVAAESGAVFTQHNDLFDVMIDSGDTFGCSDLGLVFEVFVQDAEDCLAVEEGSGVVEVS